MVTPLRIVFFGTPRFAVPTLECLLQSPHAVAGVVTQPDRPRGRGHHVSEAPVKSLAIARGLPLYQPTRLRDPEVAATLRNWDPDLGVVAAYGRLIPDEVLALPRLGMINVHASLLPKYRGAAPVHRAVMAGERETGVTIMRVIRELDAGPTFAAAARPIGPDETSDVVEGDLAALGGRLLVDVVHAMAEGAAHEERQDEALATYAPKITREDGLIDWTGGGRSIHDQVRGLHPWPHAYTFLDGARLIVLRTRVEPAAAPSRAPGTIVHVTRDALHVATGSAEAVVLEQVQPEGRRPMTVRDYLAGRPLRPGAVLGA